MNRLDPSRCAVCGLPLDYEGNASGCVRGGCAFRPLPAPELHYDPDRAVAEYGPKFGPGLAIEPGSGLAAFKAASELTRLDAQLQVRINSTRKRIYQDASEAAGAKSLAEWVIAACDAAVESQELKKKEHA